MNLEVLPTRLAGLVRFLSIKNLIANHMRLLVQLWAILFIIWGIVGWLYQAQTLMPGNWKIRNCCYNAERNDSDGK